MATLVDKAQHELVSGRPLIAIDLLLDAFPDLKGEKGTSDQKTKLLKLFSLAILQSKQADEEYWKDDPIAGLFKNTLSQTTRRFIGVCLLRLLAISRD